MKLYQEGIGWGDNGDVTPPYHAGNKPRPVREDFEKNAKLTRKGLAFIPNDPKLINLVMNEHPKIPKNQVNAADSDPNRVSESSFCLCIRVTNK